MSTAAKRLMSWILTMVMLIAILPVSALAADASEESDVIWLEEQTDVVINPLYADVITEEDLVTAPKTVNTDPASEEPVYGATYAEAGAGMREGLVAHQTEVKAYYQSANYDFYTDHPLVYAAAVAHTGNPKEGDSLRWNYGGYRVSSSGYTSGGIYYMTLTYTMTYYTTPEQEAELAAEIQTLLDTLKPTGTDYEKLTTVYDYICANITYDYDNLDIEDYKLKYTAYAALIDKTAVCQGYAVLLYQLALHMGIDCRFISGMGNGGGHGWNIIKLNDKYYNLDSTWDASWMQGVGYYNYYLQCEDTFTEGGTDHFRDAEYDTAEFHAAYPMSDTDFDPATDNIPAEPEVEPFTFVGTSMILGNSLSMRIWVPNGVLEGDEYYAEIVRSYADGQADVTVQVPFRDWIYSESNKMYYISYDDIDAKEMNDEITITAYSADGTRVSEPKTESVVAYVTRNIAKWTDAKLLTTVVDMLNYGAAAQEYFHYDEENLANAAIADYQQYATQTVDAEDIRVMGDNYVGSTLTLESQIVLTMYFRNVTRDMTAQVSYLDHYGNEKSYTVAGSEFIANGSYMGVAVDTLVVADSGQSVTCVVYDANGIEIGRATDSVESYAARMSTLDAVVEKILKFSASSYAYFH
jgi:transglutaminase-like putative cysteine protease